MTCLSCGAPLPADAARWGALECGRCLGRASILADASAVAAERRPSNNPAGRPPQLAGARRVQLYVDAETHAIVAARADRDGVSWSEALRRIVRGTVLSDLPRRPPHISPAILAIAAEDEDDLA